MRSTNKVLPVPTTITAPITTNLNISSPRLWYPKRVLFTPPALKTSWGQQIYQRVTALNLPIEELSSNRINIFQGKSQKEIYRDAKTTLAVVTAPPSSFKLNRIPPYLPTGSFILPKAARHIANIVI